MNIQTSIPRTIVVRPQLAVPAALPAALPAAEVALSTSVCAADTFESGSSVRGPLSRAVYGAAMYGLPALAGITMGINGVIPGALVGAGIGAASHLESGSQATIFAATGAAVGAGAAYIGFLGAGAGFKLPAVIVAAVVGAGSQALYAATQQ